jgi:hypothetical protein
MATKNRSQSGGRHVGLPSEREVQGAGNPLHVWTVWHPSPNPSTYEDHQLIFKSKGEAYWGTIHKLEDSWKDEFRKYIEGLESQLRRGVNAYLSIIPEDRTKYLAGRIKQIKTGQFEDWRESPLVPEYYKKLKGYEISYWFLLNAFGWLDPLKYEQYVKLLYTYSRKKYGAAGLPYPSVCEYHDEADLEALLISEPPTKRMRRHEREESGNRFVREKEGDFWTIEYQARPITLKDSKGLRYICHLLSHPGSEIACTELSNLDRMDGIKSSEARQEIMDPKALKAYKERLGDLEKEIQEAEEMGNTEEVACLIEEKAKLANEIRSTARGGRSRAFRDDREKVRDAVSRAIKRALERIAKHHPELCSHLDESLTIKGKCAYKPSQQTFWQTH